MSYSYISSVALPRAAGAQWSYPNLLTQTMGTIFSTYSDVFLVLSHNLLPQAVNVDLEPYRSTYYSSTQTLQQWLSDTIADQTLQTVASLPTGRLRYVTYTHAIPQHFKLDIGSLTGVTPNDYLLGPTDLVMTRTVPYTNMSILQRFGLISVNGYIHRTQYNSTDGKLYILDGARSARKAKNNSVGILSFYKVSQVTCMPIAEVNIQPMNVGQPLYEGLNFSLNLPVGFSLEGKSAVLVLGGYIVTVSDGSDEPRDPLAVGSFYRTGAATFRLNLGNLPYVERIVESSRYLDTYHLGIEQQLNNSALFDIAAVRSDAVIKKYLTMSQSFVCIMDTTELTARTITVRNTTAPHNFPVSNEPIYPLFAGYGRIAEYTKEYDGHAWTVNVCDPYTRNYLFANSRPPENGLISDQLVPYAPYSGAHARFVEFAGLS